MAIWQADFSVIAKDRFKEVDSCIDVWNNIEKIEKAVENISSVLPEEKSWSDDIRQFGNIEGTCLELFYEHNFIEIRCRLDMRSLDSSTLKSIINFVSTIGGVFRYRNEIIEDSFDRMVDFLKQSDEVRFCKNPKKFLANSIEHEKYRD